MTDRRSTVVIGAGPAGLTAGYLLSKAGVPVSILEADGSYVGGIARTASYKGNLFDIGGHRFFSKSQEVEDLWSELLPDDMLTRPRSSRIFYRGRFFTYPLRPLEALLKLGVVETLRCIVAYLRVRLRPIPAPRNFEEWVTNEFGARLYEIFFKTYTEKVWGMPCKDISADWAAQRIKGLSLSTVVLNAFRRRNGGSRNNGVIKTLIDSFRYPRRGPGMMWQACADRIRALGGTVSLGCRVQGCEYDAATRAWRVQYIGPGGAPGSVTAAHVISSAPLRELIRGLRPAASPDALEAAGQLKYRDFLTVVLILRDRGSFNDNWIYIHDPSVRVGRIQNFKSWSPEMVADDRTICYGLEYFCFEGDGLWNSPDDSLLGLATRELAAIGLADSNDVLDGCVVRQPKAYPVYDEAYVANVDVIRRELKARYPNLHLVGRNGMHKYNNQDHAMMTAMLTARNILAGEEVFDVWRVNQDAEYLETVSTSRPEMLGSRMVPARITKAP